MSTYRRNVAVGITVLAALLMLGWMILRFGANIAKPFAGEMIPVKFKMQRADGVSDGSAVQFRGINVGRVTKVWRDENQRDIWAEGEVDAKPPLPAKLTATILQSSPLGTGANLVITGTPDSQGDLQPNATIDATFVGLDLLPPELKAVGPELAAIAKQFKDENFVGNLNARVTQAAKLIDEAQSTLACRSARNFSSLTTRFSPASVLWASSISLAACDSAKSVVAKADAIAANVDTTVVTAAATAKSLQTRIDQMSVTLDAVAGITKKINDGTGTAGKLVNDPKLYAGLVDTTDELNAAVKDLRRLVQQWEQEGVTAKIR